MARTSLAGGRNPTSSAGAVAPAVFEQPEDVLIVGPGDIAQVPAELTCLITGAGEVRPRLGQMRRAARSRQAKIILPERPQIATRSREDEGAPTLPGAARASSADDFPTARARRARGDDSKH